MLFNIIIALGFIIGIYYGYKYGSTKVLYDFVIALIAVFISSFVYKIISNALYFIFPFFNFNGIKAFNIIIYSALVYLVIIILFCILLDIIALKLGIKDLILDKIVEASKISKLVGGVLSVLFSYLIIFNVLIYLLMPSFNLKPVLESDAANFILDKTPILSKNLSNIINSEKYIISSIKDIEITKDNYKKVNKSIISNLEENDLITKKNVKKLDKKLIGIFKEENNEINDEENNDINNDSESDNSTNDNSSIDEGEEIINPNNFQEDEVPTGDQPGEEIGGEEFGEGYQVLEIEE